MGLAKSSLNRDNVISYIEATLLQGYTKKAAYLEFINPNVRQVQGAIATMERKQEFKDLYMSIASDDVHVLAGKVAQVKTKYAKLAESNIDTMQDILDGVKDNDLKDKATAVRLANETIQAMALVNGPTQDEGSIKKLNRGSVVL